MLKILAFVVLCSECFDCDAHFIYVIGILEILLRCDQIGMYWWNIYRTLLVNIDSRFSANIGKWNTLTTSLETDERWSIVTKRKVGSNSCGIWFLLCNPCNGSYTSSRRSRSPLNNFVSRVSKWSYGIQNDRFDRVCCIARNLVHQIVVSDICFFFIIPDESECNLYQISFRGLHVDKLNRHDQSLFLWNNILELLLPTIFISLSSRNE